MKNLVLCLGVLLSLTVSAQHVPKSLTASNGQFIGFYQYTPTNYNSSTKYPVIIFLHGIGERGNGTTDLPNLLGLGVPGAINGGHNMTFTWNGKTETFLVLSPQLDTKYGSWQNFYVEEMINYAKKNLSIDENRIYLTGLSLGGGGVWSYSGATVDNAKKLAAIGVCCGTCQNLNYCNYATANLPVWAFHANDDGTVGAGCTTGAISAINKCNPAVAPYMTIWPDGQHWIWGRVFSTDYSWQNPNIYEWFLGQDKSKAVNKRPVAEAGSALSILNTLGVVTLDASKSTDADGKIVRSIWRKISGPAYGNITAAVSINGNTTVTGLTLAGTYQYELKVVDDRADWSLDTVTVTVGVGSGTTTNKLPTASAGADVTITLPTNSVTLTGTGTDADGYIAAYGWTKSSGPTSGTIVSSTSAKTEISNLAEGTYTFKLTVTDNNSATATDEVTVVVNPVAGSKPTTSTANAGDDATITLPTTIVTLDGSASVDPYGGSLKSYKWVKTSGPTGGTVTSSASVTTTATGLTEGTYVFSLTVWDSKWVPVTDTKTVIVKPATTTTPSTGGGTVTKVANAGADITITLPTTATTLNGSASTDPNGVIKSWKWAQISGPGTATIASSTSSVSAVSALKQGTYAFKLTVWNNQWVPVNDTVQVIVKAATSSSNSTSGADGLPADGSVANAGANITVSLPSNSATLDGSASSDPAGAIKAWSWTKISGPEQHNIANASVATTTVSNLVEGTYQFKLVVWDSKWVPYADTVIVTVVSSSTALRSTSAASVTTTETARSTTSTTTTEARTSAYAEQVLLYPNPVKTSLNVQTTSSNTGASMVSVYDMSGKLMQKTAFQKSAVLHQQSLNVANLAPGVYSIEVVIDNKTRFNSKFVKQP